MCPFVCEEIHFFLIKFLQTLSLQLKIYVILTCKETYLYTKLKEIYPTQLRKKSFSIK
jgi:ribosome biogenesis protein Nip4